MKINQTKVMAILAVGALLALSPAARAQDASTNTPPKAGASHENHQGGPRFSPEQQLEHLTQVLSLTDDQKPKVKAALEAQAKSMEGIRDLPPDERREKFRAAREELGKQLKTILTDEQYKKWESMPRGPRPHPQSGGDDKPADAPKSDAPKS